MKQAHVDEYYTAYLEGSLPEPLRREVEAHLRDCSRCAAELASLRLIVHDLRHLPEETPQVDMAAAVRARLAARPRPRAFSFLRLPALAGGLAVVTLAVLLIMLRPATLPWWSARAPSPAFHSNSLSAGKSISSPSTVAPSRTWAQHSNNERLIASAPKELGIHRPAQTFYATPGLKSAESGRVAATMPLTRASKAMPRVPLVVVPSIGHHVSPSLSASAAEQARQKTADNRGVPNHTLIAKLPEMHSARAAHGNRALTCKSGPSNETAAQDKLAVISSVDNNGKQGPARLAGPAGVAGPAGPTGSMAKLSVSPVVQNAPIPAPTVSAASSAPPAIRVGDTASSYSAISAAPGASPEAVASATKNTVEARDTATAGVAVNANMQKHAVTAHAPAATPNRLQPATATLWWADNSLGGVDRKESAHPATAEQGFSFGTVAFWADGLPSTIEGVVQLRVNGTTPVRLTVHPLDPAFSTRQYTISATTRTLRFTVPSTPDGAAVELTFHVGRTAKTLYLLVPGTNPPRAIISLQAKEQLAYQPLLHLASDTGVYVLCPRELANRKISCTATNVSPLTAMSTLLQQQHYQLSRGGFFGEIIPAK